MGNLLFSMTAIVALRNCAVNRKLSPRAGRRHPAFAGVSHRPGIGLRPDFEMIKNENEYI
jgi:hypothetical protein